MCCFGGLPGLLLDYSLRIGLAVQDDCRLLLCLGAYLKLIGIRDLGQIVLDRTRSRHPLFTMQQAKASLSDFVKARALRHSQPVKQFLVS